MKIPEYLAEIQHAVETVITEIYREQRRVTELRGELSKLSGAADDGYRRVDFLSLNPDLDDEGLGTAIYWDTYFGVDKDRHRKSVEVDDAGQRVAAHEFSVAALAGNLLQYGKQGLSLHFGKARSGCPSGRLVAGLPLHDIIWHGRNQALHWEDGAFHEPTRKLFEHLAANADPVFSQYRLRSMAYEIITLVGWQSADDFFRDMRLFVL